MRSLVTGGAGFIGSCFVRHMLKNHPDYKIINLDALTYAGNIENLDDVKDNPNYTFVHGNLCIPGRFCHCRLYCRIDL